MAVRAEFELSEQEMRAKHCSHRTANSMLRDKRKQNLKTEMMMMVIVIVVFIITIISISSNWAAFSLK